MHQVQNIDTLSDDETHQIIALPTPGSEIAKRRPAKRKAKSLFTVPMVDGRALRHRVEGSCGCLCKCFLPFRRTDMFEKLLKVRKTMAGLGKLEQDDYVSTLS